VAEFEREARRILGDDGFEELKRADDAYYREAAKFAREHQLPKVTAVTLQQLRSTTDEQRERILQARDLSRDAQAAALEHLKRSAVNGVEQALGSMAAVYQEQQQGWFQSLDKLPPPPVKEGE
jgi:hypothetical protein